MVNRMKRNHKQFDFRTSFIDLLLNVLVFILFISAITTMIMQMKKITEEGPLRKAEYIATVTWDDKINCDVDIWARDPDGVVVSFNNKDQGMMNLERDDLGFYNDMLTIARDALTQLEQGGGLHPNKLVEDQFNEETLVFRGVKMGKYLVNVNLYSCTVMGADGQKTVMKIKQPFDLKVHMKLMKINPYKIVYTEDVEFKYVKEELNMVEFEIDKDKNIVSFDKSPVKLIKELGKW